MPRRPWRQRAERELFTGTLKVVAHIARLGLREPVAWVLGRVATAVRAYRRARPVVLTPEALGREWQRLMPNPKWMPVTEVTEDTAFGEIQVRCPLRGTGDVEACHALMAYDRALMRPAGGRFVVLESQAELGVDRCRIAIRPMHLPAEDLEPAHVRVDRLVRRAR